MTFKSFRPAALGASILILAAAGAAVAQTPPPGPGMMGGAHEMAGPMQGHGDHAAMAQKHAQRLRDVLQLTPAQEPALQALIAAMKPPEGMREHMRDEREDMAKLTTPQRLDRMKAHMAEREAMMDQHIAAVKRFYAQLTPTQQRAFDSLPPMMMGHHGPGGMMGGHRMGGMDGHDMKDGHKD